MAVVTVTLVATLLSLPVIGLAGVLTVKAAAIAGASVWLFVGFKQRPEFSRAVLRDLGLVAQDATWLVVLGGLSGGILLLENWFASAMPEGRLTTISWARQFAFMISMLLQGGMRQVLSAHFQELVRDEKRGQLLASVRKIIEYSVMMGALVAVGTFFAGREGLQILFGGSSWRPEAITRLWEVCSVYSLVILVACLGGLLVPVLVATKSFRLFLLVELVRLGSFTLCAWLWREHDLIGLAAAQVVQQFLGTGLVVILVCGYLQRKPCWSDLKVFFRLAAVIAPTAAGLWLGQTAAHWLMPAATGVMGAWRHLALIICIALPGFSTTLWLGSCWEVPPMKQATQAARRFLNRHRAGIPNR
jgi:peptidoglycan biosynthesis protein MviN/MurJ (putative lipid II flippase)